MGARAESLRGTRQRKRVGSFDSLGYRPPIPQTRVPLAPAAIRRTPASILILRAPIAQLVELRTFNPQVLGSSPSGGTRPAVFRGLLLRRTRMSRRRPTRWQRVDDARLLNGLQIAASR